MSELHKDFGSEAIEKQKGIGSSEKEEEGEKPRDGNS
jgi:hypothetical protein